jgi:hypothetical protein
MALETLKNFTCIDGINLCDVTDKEDITDDAFVAVDHNENVIYFKIQQGPIKEVGLNGCQVTDMIKVAKHIIEKLSEKYPCIENDNTVAYLDLALNQQAYRARNREARGVEGISKQ